MARFMVGTGGFEYTYDVGRKSIDLSHLAAAAGVGTPLFAVEYLVSFAAGAPEVISFREMGERTGLEAEGPSSLYEGRPGQDPQAAFELACTVAAAGVPALLGLYNGGGKTPSRVELRGRAQFRLTAAEWSRMLEWLNSYLPAALKLTLDKLKGFDLGAIAAFDPEEDGQGDLVTGTQQASFLYAANADRYLPYLGLRILAHAVKHALDPLIVEETDQLWRGTLWKAP